MTNKASSFPAAPQIGPLHRYGGRITALGELPIHALGDSFTVDGSGTVLSLPTLQAGVIIFLKISNSPTFTNSSKLICPNNQNYTALPGDLVVARSKDDGVWQLYVLANPGGWNNVRLAKAAAYSVVNADRGSTIALGGSAFYTITVNAASGYDPNFSVTVLNEDAGRGKTIACNGLSSFILWPGQTCTIYNQNNVWRVSRPLRWKLTATTTFYVDGSLGNDTNDGLATGAGAFLTIQAAINNVRDNIDAGSQLIVVQVADGTYTGNVRLFPVFGSYQSGSHNEAILRGNVASLGNVTINTTNANCIDACNCWFPWRVEGFKFQTTTSGSHIALEFDSKIYVGTNQFDVAAGGGNHISLAYRSIAEIVANYTISGNASFHKYASSQSHILGTGTTITVTGTPAFASAFALAVELAFILENGSTYSGAATGTRYSASLNSVIDTGGGGATYYPGNVSGSTASGGQYI